jgi:hypothetical protein
VLNLLTGKAEGGSHMLDCSVQMGLAEKKFFDCLIMYAFRFLWAESNANLFCNVIMSLITWINGYDP